MTWIETFLEQLQTARTLRDVQNLVVSLRDSLGVEHAIYHVAGDTGQEYGALTYDEEWVKQYISEKHMNVDPVVKHALRSTGPIDWRQLDWSPAPARRLLGEAVAAGVGKQGYTIPLRGVGGKMSLFSVSSFDNDGLWSSFGDEHLHDLILAGHYIHQRAAQIMGEDRTRLSAELTPRERDVLTLLSRGSSRAQAAEYLRISQHTLRDYIDTARLKLDAQNTTHAVVTAMAQGLLLP